MRYVAGLYQKHRHLRFLTLKKLYMGIGILTDFVAIKPIGKVVVTYCLHENRVQVKADYSLLTKDNIQKIFAMNEQAATFFRKYLDSNGIELFEEHIGA